MNDFNPANPHSCRCGRRWTGFDTAHCVSCHATFTSVTGFDKHRKDGECINPPEVGLVDAGRTYSCWKQKGPQGGFKALKL